MSFLTRLPFLPLKFSPANIVADQERTDRVGPFIVFIWVLLALAAVIVIGALIWCYIHANSGLQVLVQINPWTFEIWCY